MSAEHRPPSLAAVCVAPTAITPVAWPCGVTRALLRTRAAERSRFARSALGGRSAERVTRTRSGGC